MEDNAQWTGPSTLECASMEGRRAVIDVGHYPTALQVCFRALVRAYCGGSPIRYTVILLDTLVNMIRPVLQSADSVI